MAEENSLLSELASSKKKLNSASNERALLAGATPLLVGLLSGGGGEAIEIASQGLLAEDQRSQKEESALMDYLKKKQIAEAKGATGSKRYQAIPYETEQGDIKIGTFDTYTGSLAEGDKIRGYRKGHRVDPTTKELVETSGGTGLIAEAKRDRPQKERPFTIKEEEDIRGLRKAFLSDPEVKKSRSAIAASGRAIELLKSGNPVADEGIKIIFPRMFGEVGNLAVQEQERFTGSPELRRRYERLKSKWFETGKLTDEDRADLIEVAQVMGAYDQRRLKSAFEKYAKSEELISGIGSKRIKPTIKPFSEDEISKGEVSRRVKKDFTTRLTGEDKSAYEWAIKNKKSEESKAILNHLREKYGVQSK